MMSARSHGILAASHRAISVLETVSMALAGLGLFAMMMVIVADVAARYFFRSPLPWAFDFISLYLMPAVFFLALSHTLREDHHVNVDILLNAVPVRVSQAMRSVGHGLAVVVFLAMAHAAVSRTWEAYESGAVTSGIIQWPTWVASAFVVAGAALILLRTAFRAIAFALAALTGAPDVPGATVAVLAEEEEL